MKSILAASFVLLALTTAAQASPSERYDCGGQHILMKIGSGEYSVVRGEKTGNLRFDVLPARLFRWDGDTLYYRGKRCEYAPLNLPPPKSSLEWDPPPRSLSWFDVAR